jgi:hypothetical protein
LSPHCSSNDNPLISPSPSRLHAGVVTPHLQTIAFSRLLSDHQRSSRAVAQSVGKSMIVMPSITEHRPPYGYSSFRRGCFSWKNASRDMFWGTAFRNKMYFEISQWFRNHFDFEIRAMSFREEGKWVYIDENKLSCRAPGKA